MADHERTVKTRNCRPKGLWQMLRCDLRAALDNDPAARGPLASVEVILTYPGFHAIVLHRFTHLLSRTGLPLLPRMLSVFNRFLTGIEIHPGARIGAGLFIDHGMGVVIGETAIVGEHCVLFHGVTLGGTGKETGKRHPTLGDRVVIGAGAKILGNITLGNDVYVGANSVVLNSVPADCTVVGIPGRVVKEAGQKVRLGPSLDHIHMPDPVRDRLMALEAALLEVTAKVEELEAVVRREAPVSAENSD